MSSEVKVLSALAGGVFHLQQLLEEMEMPIMEPTTCCSDNRGCVQVVEDPAPGAVSPGQTRSTDPTKARSPSLVQQ